MKRLGLLLPPLDGIRAGDTPLLARVLARADRLPDVVAGDDATLQRFFDIHPRKPLAPAPLSRLVDADDAETAAWVRADPAHVRADMAAGRLMACGELGLLPEEISRIERKLKPLFGDFGFEFSAPHPSRWYLRAPREAKLPAFHAPEAVLGRDMMEFLPTGDNAARWRQLLNEAQILLHNHPVNAERAERGAVAVNSLWFWGGGVLPDSVRTERSHVASGDALVDALARLAKTKTIEATLDAQHELPLIDLRARADWLPLEHEWIAPAIAALAKGKLDALELASVNGRAFSYRHAHRWRFWRRVAAA